MTASQDIWPPFFTRGLWLAFLLREDVRGPDPSSLAAREEFFLWWLCGGRLDYPGIPGPDATQIAFANAPVATGNPGQTLPRILFYLWRMRPDLQTAFPLGEVEAVQGFAEWYLIHGLDELGLTDTLSPAQIAGLKAPCSWLPTDTVPPVSNFMAMKWRHRADLRQAFDLGTAKGRQAFVAWFHDHAGTESATVRALLSCLEIKRKAVPRTARPSGCNLIGFARGELGIGEDIRMVAKALASQEVPFAVTNIQAGPNTRQTDRVLDQHFDDSAPYDTNLICLTGFETARIFIERGDGLFEGRRTIGLWPWELPRWPALWQPALALVDEIWAATLFSAEAYGQAGGPPVRLMPSAVSVERLMPLPRAETGIPEDAFAYLFLFDFNSTMARKCPGSVLEAFAKAFPLGTEKTALVMKCMNARSDDPAWQRLQARASADPRIILINRTLRYGHALGLIDSCDALVSLHRAEGFGRTLAEAMLLGKPVIATDYSGNADFLMETTGFPVRWTPCRVGSGEYYFGDGQIWAEPDAEDAARLMRLVHEDPERRTRIAMAGQEFIRRHYAPETVGVRYARRLAEFFPLPVRRSA